MLCFRSEAEVEAWCARRRIPRGAILTLDQMWSLSEIWYPGRAEREWQGRTQQASEALFRAVGLTGDFWTF